METRRAVDVFDHWAQIGKDEGMERGHAPSVEYMIGQMLNEQTTQFSVLDVGCGNGWVVRKFSHHPLCVEAHGVDGALSMVQKAQSIDSTCTYHHGLIPQWHPPREFTMIHSMEFLYYLHEPLEFLKILHNEWLAPSGKVIFGLDHYTENESSLEWPASLQVHMTCWSISEWASAFESAGFRKVSTIQIGQKEGWEGTLVIQAESSR